MIKRYLQNYILDDLKEDFLITVQNRIWFCVEVKSSYKKDVPVSLKYFGKKLKIPFIYEVVKDGTLIL